MIFLIILFFKYSSIKILKICWSSLTYFFLLYSMYIKPDKICSKKEKEKSAKNEKRNNMHTNIFWSINHTSIRNSVDNLTVYFNNRIVDRSFRNWEHGWMQLQLRVNTWETNCNVWTTEQWEHLSRASPDGVSGQRMKFQTVFCKPHFRLNMIDPRAADALLHRNQPGYRLSRISIVSIANSEPRLRLPRLFRTALSRLTLACWQSNL